MQLVNFPNKLKIRFILLFLLIVNFGNAQNRIQEIERLTVKAAEENYQYNYSKSVEFALKAYQLSLKKSYPIGLVESQYELAYAHYGMGKYGEGLEFLNNITQTNNSTLEKNDQLYLKFTELKGKILLWIGFKEKSKDEFLQFLKLSSYIEDENLRNHNELKAYSLLGINVEDDSSKYYSLKAISYQKKIKDSKEFILPYVNLARYYLKRENNLDSATYFNQLASKIAIETNSRYLFLTSLQDAELEYKKGNFDKAQIKAKSALRLAKDQNRGLEILEAYQLIAQNYEKQNLFKEQSFYLKKYIEVNDSIRNDLRSDLFSEIVSMETEIINQQRKTQKIFTVMMIAFLILIACLAFLGYRSLKHKRKAKKNKEIILTKDIEIKNLQFKLEKDNEVDLLDIAQNNPKEFPARFSEVHKEFVDKLLKIEPNLVASEITFCAYLKLKFSTKDIANIMYVTPKAIQNRKNRIRKKLNIPSEEDIYVWFNKL